MIYDADDTATGIDGATALNEAEANTHVECVRTLMWHPDDDVPGELAPWAPAEIFPEGGKITDTSKIRHVFGAPYKKSTFFGAPKAQTKMFAFFRDVSD